MVTDRRQKKQLRDRRTPANQVLLLNIESIQIFIHIYTNCYSSFSKLIKSIVENMSVFVLLVPTGADGHAHHVQGEEENGQHHAEPTGQKWGRVSNIFTIGER